MRDVILSSASSESSGFRALCICLQASPSFELSASVLKLLQVSASFFKLLEVSTSFFKLLEVLASFFKPFVSLLELWHLFVHLSTHLSELVLERFYRIDVSDHLSPSAVKWSIDLVALFLDLLISSWGTLLIVVLDDLSKFFEGENVSEGLMLFLYHLVLFDWTLEISFEPWLVEEQKTEANYLEKSYIATYPW